MATFKYSSFLGFSRAVHNNCAIASIRKMDRWNCGLRPRFNAIGKYRLNLLSIPLLAAAMCGAGTGFYSGASSAEPVTFNFEGPAIACIHPGPCNTDSFVTGSITFETNTPGTPLSPVEHRMAYFDAVVSLEFSTQGTPQISRSYECGTAQVWEHWSGDLDLLLFSCEPPGSTESYNLGATGVAMLKSLALPDTPPDSDRVQFHWNYHDPLNEYHEEDVVSSDIQLVLPAITVNVDVRPGSGTNGINLRSRNGTIPVAILTSETFDALQIDWSTVTFGPGGATERHRRVHVEDVDGDGDMDAILHFRTDDIGVACDDGEVALAGETFGGGAFVGSDSVTILKCPK